MHQLAVRLTARQTAARAGQQNVTHVLVVHLPSHYAEQHIMMQETGVLDVAARPDLPTC